VSQKNKKSCKQLNLQDYFDLPGGETGSLAYRNKII